MRKGGRKMGFRGRHAREVIRSRTRQVLASGLPIGRMNQQVMFHVWTQESAARRVGVRVQRGPAKERETPDTQGKVQGARKPLKDD